MVSRHQVACRIRNDSELQSLKNPRKNILELLQHYTKEKHSIVIGEKIKKKSWGHQGSIVIVIKNFGISLIFFAFFLESSQVSSLSKHFSLAHFKTFRKTFTILHSFFQVLCELFSQKLLANSLKVCCILTVMSPSKKTLAMQDFFAPAT